jgi:hypothetical protein
MQKQSNHGRAFDSKRVLSGSLLAAILTSVCFVVPAFAQWYPNSYYVNPGYNNYNYRGYAPYGAYGGGYEGYPNGYGYRSNTVHNVAVGAGIGAIAGAAVGLLASHHHHRGYYY